ncbi:MAG: hypothetical protein K0U34_04155 [Alphaproteobacteria bacterium]|nr:hypothetical protein [Alphaproteobacteria bacterium]
MVFWRKKNDGFEWQKYVRTTVLVRRKERRQKLEEAGAAAVFGVRQAQWKTLAHMRTAALAVGRGLVACARALRSGAIKGWTLGWPRVLSALAATGHGLQAFASAVWRGIGAGMFSTGQALMAAATAMRIGFARHISPRIALAVSWLGAYLRPLFVRLGEPELAMPLGLVAGISGVATAAHLVLHGLSGETLLIGSFALALFTLWIAALNTRDPATEGGSFPLRSRIAEWWSQRSFQMSRLLSPTAIAVPTVIAVAGFGAWQFYDRTGGAPELPQLPSLSLPNIEVSAINPFKAETLTGRATVLDGGHLRIARQTIRLDDIEALLPAQTCETSRARTWRCGRSATAKLKRLVRRRRITCTIAGEGTEGIKRATCSVAERDLGAELVRLGYAFAAPGLLTNYKSEEAEARANKRGIWQGTALRPAEYRAARWQQATKKAPGGCPIKGRVHRRKRLYALPWDRGYDRVRVRERRGGQWFCSEQEARQAGFVHPSQT